LATYSRYARGNRQLPCGPGDFGYRGTTVRRDHRRSAVRAGTRQERDLPAGAGGTASSPISRGLCRRLSQAVERGPLARGRIRVRAARGAEPQERSGPVGNATAVERPDRGHGLDAWGTAEAQGPPHPPLDIPRPFDDDRIPRHSGDHARSHHRGPSPRAELRRRDRRDPQGRGSPPPTSAASPGTSRIVPVPSSSAWCFAPAASRDCRCRS
jgi:hypothetical protein